TTATLPGWKTLGNIGLRQASAEGLHQLENWGGTRVNWTMRLGIFHFHAGGQRVIATYSVGHNDLNAAHPLQVDIRIYGTPKLPGVLPYAASAARHAAKGLYHQTVDISAFEPGDLTFAIEVDRTYVQPPDPRQLGVALQQLTFE